MGQDSLRQHTWVGHTGAPPFLPFFLAKGEQALGVSSHALQSADPPFSPPTTSAETELGLNPQPSSLSGTHARVAVIHGMWSLAPAGGARPQEALGHLERIKGSGSKVVVWAQPGDPLPLLREVVPHVDALIAPPHVLQALATAGQPETGLSEGAVPRTLEGASALSIPFPIAAELIASSQARDYQRGTSYDFRVLMVPFQAQPQGVTRLKEGLSARRSVELVIRTPEEIASLEQLIEEIRSSDAVVELAQGEGYGPIAALALALARPVFSGCSPLLKKTWAAMEMCPVVHSTEETVVQRINACLQEPRTLRDFGRRGQAFAKQQHNAERIAQMTTQLYERLVTGAVSK